MDGTYAALLGALIGGFFGAAGVVLGTLIVQRGETRRLRSQIAMQAAIEHYRRFCADLENPPSRETLAAPGMLDIFYHHALEAIDLSERGRRSDAAYLQAGEAVRQHYADIVRRANSEKKSEGKK